MPYSKSKKYALSETSKLGETLQRVKTTQPQHLPAIGRCPGILCQRSFLTDHRMKMTFPGVERLKWERTMILITRDVRSSCLNSLGTERSLKQEMTSSIIKATTFSTVTYVLIIDHKQWQCATVLSVFRFLFLGNRSLPFIVARSLHHCSRFKLFFSIKCIRKYCSFYPEFTLKSPVSTSAS